MKLDASKLQLVVPAALIPFVLPFTTLAAEGTGRVSIYIKSNIFNQKN